MVPGDCSTKRYAAKSIASVLCSLLFILSFFSSPLMGYSVDGEQQYCERFILEFHENDLEFSVLNGYDLISMEGCDYLTDDGKPQLPVKEIRIAVPDDIQIEAVCLEHLDTELIPGTYTLYPSQPPMTTNSEMIQERCLQVDSSAYRSSLSYPTTIVTFEGMTDLAGQSLGIIRISPLQYLPVEKQLLLHTKMTLVVMGKSGYVCGDYLPPSLNEQGRFLYESMVQDMVINPESVHLQTSIVDSSLLRGLPSGGPYDHVIITSSTFSSSWDPLVEWHTKRGLKDTVVTTDYIYTHYNGSSNQQKIRNFVIDAYNSWGTVFFLMGGENATVPFEQRTYFIDDPNTPSDQYYSDFDDDWTHEVFVGRAPVDNTTQISTFIDKVLFYEKTPPLTNYTLDVLLLGMDLDDQTKCETLKEIIASYIPQRFSITKIYDSQPGQHLILTIDALNAGQQLVNHAGHGTYTYMDSGHSQGLTNAMVDVLTNTNQMSVITSLACYVNGMDYSDCIAEHFVVYNPLKAGVAFTGNTRSGYVETGQPTTLSGFLDRYWWRGLFLYNKYLLGETMVWSKHQFPTTGQDANLKMHCEWEFNLLGDPSMPLWTDTPLPLNVSHPATLPTGSSSFLVHVTSGGSSVSSALVCLWKGTEVYLTGMTNGNGDITFAPSPQTTGLLYVTATKHNYLPVESVANVQPLVSPLLLDGYCYYNNMTPVQSLTVDLVNMNTGASWEADTTTNYYSKILLAGVDLHTGDTLRLIAKDGNDSVNITDHIITSTDIQEEHIQTDMIISIHYRDLYHFPFYLSEVNTGAMVMKMMMDYLMWNSTTHPDGPPSVYSEQTFYDNYSGGDSLSGDEMWRALNDEVDDHGHGWIYGYFFNPRNSTNVTDVLRSICVWLDYPVDYYNDIRDVDVPKPGHPNHVPIAVATGGDYENWMVVRGIYTDKNSWPPGGHLPNITVYGFWLNDPKEGGLGGNTYVTIARFLSAYFLPITLAGDTYEGQYYAITDPLRNYNESLVERTTITFSDTTVPLSRVEQMLLRVGQQGGPSLVFKGRLQNLLIRLAYEQTMEILQYDTRGLADSFREAIAYGTPHYKNGLWTIYFYSEDLGFNVLLNRNGGLEQFSIEEK